jgi:branched-subunit amino acid ABC-type transport system permease component
MQDIIFFFILGLGLGSLYAMLGVGLVIGYRGSGVINFAFGAMAMYGVFTFDEAKNNGAIQLPWVDFLPTDWLNIPQEISVGDGGVSTPVAFAIAIAMSVLIGLMIHFLAFRPLRNAAPLGKVIGSVGVMLYLQGVAQLHFGGTGRQPSSIVPDEPIDDFLGLGYAMPQSTLWAIGFALVTGLVLSIFYRKTRFGLATQAAASNEKGAVLLGYSPQFLAALNWVIAAVLATVTAIIVGPIQGSLTPIGLTGLVVVALGAALVGNLKGIMTTTIAGLLLGGSIQVLEFWAREPWFPEFLRTGVRQAVPLVVIGAVLFLRGKALPLRGTLEEKRLPLSPRPVRVWQHALVWGGLAIAAAFIFEDSGSRTVFAFALTTSLIAAIVMLSMVIITGYSGQISLAQMSLAGVSAFFMARMLADGSTTATNPFPVSGPDLPWPIAAVLGVAVAVVVGVVLGLPAVRIRGVQLAVVTLAFAISLQTLYLENRSLTDLSAGAPANIPRPYVFGIDVGSVGDKGLNDNPSFTVFVVVVLILCCFAVANLRRNDTGRRFLAVRANERAASAAGINVTRTKLLAFALAAGFAGIGGVMLGFKQVDVSSANFVYQASLVFLAFAYLGGITSINGAIVGGLLAPAGVITVVSNYFFKEADITSYVTIIGGASLVLTAVLHPEGIAPFFQPLFRYFGSWLLRARGAEWLAVAKRLGPWFVTGVVLGYLVWPLRVDSYSSFWMPLLGGFLALFIRVIFLQVKAAVTGQGGQHGPPGHEPPSTPSDVAAADVAVAEPV